MQRPTHPSRRAGFAVHATLAIALVVGPVLTLPPVATADTEAMGSIVKVFSARSLPDYASPWQRCSVENVTGSGAIIDGDRILTNAHVIAYAVDVQVARHDDPERYAARVLFVDHERDLALLTVDDASFFEGRRPLPLGSLPSLQSRVQVCGFPIGGESLSITEGVLSRVETDMYTHSFRDNLVAQIDAAMNSGNSGGPVLAEGKLIGLAMQTLDDAENVGYCIPAPVVQHFLRDSEDGSVDGLPSLGVLLQTMRSPALREARQMPVGATGGLVARVLAGTSADGRVQPQDVILEIDGIPVANDLTVKLEPFGQIDCEYLAWRKQVGEPISLKLLRGGQEIAVDFELRNTPDLVAAPRFSTPREFLLCGGLILAPLDIEYLYVFEDIPYNLSAAAFANNETTPDRRQAVVLIRILPHPVNQGYREFEDLILMKIGGETVRDFAHARRLLEQCDEKWIDLVFDDGTRIVLPTAQVRTADAEVRETYAIRAAAASRAG